MPIKNTNNTSRIQYIYTHTHTHTHITQNATTIQEKQLVTIMCISRLNINTADKFMQ